MLKHPLAMFGERGMGGNSGRQTPWEIICSGLFFSIWASSLPILSDFSEGSSFWVSGTVVDTAEGAILGGFRRMSSRMTFVACWYRNTSQMRKRNAIYRG